MDKNQKSYIKVICDEEADPRYNKLQLRTEPPTYIELQPGENILTVEDYPALKYGFSQINDYGYEDNLDLAEECPYEYNGGGILEVDFSNFDASEVTSMDNMFLHFDFLRKIEFGECFFSNIQSASSAFDRVGNGMDKLDLTSIDFSKVKDTSYMLNGVTAKTFDLYGADFSSVEIADEMFTNIEAETLIFDTARGIAELADIIPFQDGFIEKVSLKGCKRDAIEAFAMAIYESGRNVEIDLGKSWGCKVVDGEFKLLREVKVQNPLTNWLTANPSKTKLDWLIETRCTTDEQRAALTEILYFCDANNVSYEIGKVVNIRDEYKEYIKAHPENVNEIIKFYEENNLGTAPIEFKRMNTEKFKKEKNKFVQGVLFDLYFPSVGWFINIGKEIDDAVTATSRISNIWIKGELPTLASLSTYQDLAGGFHAFLENKYHLPLIKRKDEWGWHHELLLPWNHEIVESESIKNYRKLPFEIGDVYRFWSNLFKDDFDTPCGIKSQLKSIRRDKFLTSYPEIKEKRENMLHTLVIGMQQEEGIAESINIYDIRTLLETVDNELAVLYPEYDKAINYI